MKKIIFAVLLSVAVLTGCSTVPVKSEPIISQQNLLVKCTYDTPVPERNGVDKDGKPASTGEDLINALFKYQDVYNVCAVTHDKLVDAIIEQQEAKKVLK